MLYQAESVQGKLLIRLQSDLEQLSNLCTSVGRTCEGAETYRVLTGCGWAAEPQATQPEALLAEDVRGGTGDVLPVLCHGTAPPQETPCCTLRCALQLYPLRTEPSHEKNIVLPFSRSGPKGRVWQGVASLPVLAWERFLRCAPFSLLLDPLPICSSRIQPQLQKAEEGRQSSSSHSQ